MNLPAVTPGEFVLGLLHCGLFMLLCIIFPVQLSAKLRRRRFARTHLTCRICGYRFLRREDDPECRCPHCGVRN
ncbi:MAG: hypothetical protein ACI4PZ_07260 [Akkermansia sp.]